MENNVKFLTLPLQKDQLAQLHIGDMVKLSGKLLVFRDAGHKRLFQSIQDDNQAFDYVGGCVYFMGPCPAQKGQALGSAGPTTSCRMDKYTPYMLDNGLVAQIGKGQRDNHCIEAFRRNGAVYFAAIGGAGAMYSTCITDAKIIAFDDLGTEAIREITVKDFPVVVAIDSQGNNIYDQSKNNNN